MKIDLQKIQEAYESYDGLREQLIAQSRLVLKSSKQLIYSIHRGNKNEAVAFEKALKKDFKKLLDVVEKQSDLSSEGSFSEASEEYAEAALYFDYSYQTHMRTSAELHVSDEVFLGAVSDLTGELTRKAVQLVVKGQSEDVEAIYAFVSDIFSQLLKFNFRNGGVRKKFDAVKWNLAKLEDILYDLSLKKSKTF